MKLFNTLMIAMVLTFASATTFAQTSKTVPELVFQNPTLIAGTAGADGAKYRFPSVVSNVDAIVTIRRRSSSSVVLTNIDVSNLGWNKAFQPQLGISGNVPAYQNWWMEFEMRFVDAGTTNDTKIKDFVVTSLDVDGDNASISEYIQLNGVTSAKFCPVTYLVQKPTMALNTLDAGSIKEGETSVMIQGPVQNFTDIDTSATSVMATYTYSNKNVISFYIGAKSSSVISNAGERLNSLWFKSFSLAQQTILPLKMSSFTALYDTKNVTLSWTTDYEKDFSHFVIERSDDGKNFKEVALVFSNGDAEQKTTYQYKDAAVSSSTGVVIYRIRFVENTRESYYSDVRIVRLDKADDAVKITTFPNPVADQVQVTLPSAWQGKAVMLELFNGNGSRVQSQQVTNAAATEVLKLNNLSHGFYVVKATCGNAVAQQRIVKN